MYVCVHICSSPFRLRGFYLPYHMLPPAEYDFFHRWTKNKKICLFLLKNCWLSFLTVCLNSQKKKRRRRGTEADLNTENNTVCFFLSNSPPKALEMHFSTFKCCLKVHSDFSSLEQRALGDGLSVGVRRALPRPHPKSYSRAPCQRLAVATRKWRRCREPD